MSVYIYDEALLGKLKTWTENTNVHIYGPNDSRRLFQIIADETDDKPLQLPIISLTRRGGYTLANPNKRVQTYDGITKSADMKKSRQINAIPIEISYQLDIYTRYLKEADSYTRDLVFNIVNHPTFKVVVPYMGANIEHNANMILSPDIADNSDIPERLITGQFSRMSLFFTIEDAYLWDIRDRNNVRIGNNDVTEGDSGLSVDIRRDDEDYRIERIPIIGGNVNEQNSN